MAKVVVLDNLTETFSGHIVRSGLQKSSKLDARAFAKLGHDVTYIYCGSLEDDYPYTKLSINDIGAKEHLMRDGKNPRATGVYLKKYLQDQRVAMILNDADYIIAHCHSVGMITSINSIANEKKILFVIHDVIDMTWAVGFSQVLIKAREKTNNKIFIATNSRYSIDKLNYIHERCAGKEYLEGKNLLSGDEVFDGFIEHFVWTDVEPTEEQILSVEPKSAIIGRYEPNKYHHKVYGYNNPNNVIVHYGIKDPRRDEGLKYYENLKIKANSYAEDLSDDELWSAIKSSQSIILPCWHEGFGFTAFEAGIFGVAPVILTRPIENGEGKVHRHATVEYLTRSGTKHFSCKFNDRDDIHATIDKSLEITGKDRLSISKSLLDYFTVNNYVDERLRIMDSIESRYESQNLERFFA